MRRRPPYRPQPAVRLCSLCRLTRCNCIPATQPVYPPAVDPWAPHPIVPHQYRPEVNR